MPFLSYIQLPGQLVQPVPADADPDEIRDGIQYAVYRPCHIQKDKDIGPEGAVGNVLKEQRKNKGYNSDYKGKQQFSHHKYIGEA
ncbi:hypothetical protein D3C76_1751930 [compost metagenome]